MFNKYAWKQPIFKSDLFPVLLNGLIFCILGGILGGLIDYLAQLIGLSISFGLIILCYFIGKKVNQGYHSYHILYPTLTILFMIIGIIFSEFTYLLCYIKSFEVFKNFISLKFIINIITSPITSVIKSILVFNLLNTLLYAFNLIMYILAFVYAYRFAKGRN